MVCDGNIVSNGKTSGFFGGLSFQYHGYINPNNLGFTDVVIKNVKKQNKYQTKEHDEIDAEIMKGDYMKLLKIKHVLKKKKALIKYHNYNKFVTDINYISGSHDVEEQEEEKEKEKDGDVERDQQLFLTSLLNAIVSNMSIIMRISHILLMRNMIH